MSQAWRHRLLGVAAVLVIAGLAAATAGSFAQVFTPSVDVAVLTDRSGLLLDPGSDVTVRGIVVGQVRRVEPDGDEARLAVALDPDMVDTVPADSTANITAPTVFGAKYVDLSPGTAAPIAAGDTLRAGSVSTEGNTVLGGLYTLLSSVDVAQLNSALGALSTALDGRGRQLGETAVQFDRYLSDLQPSLPALTRDLREGGAVADNLADAAPDLLRVLDNLSVTSGTLVDERPALNGVLRDLVVASDDTRGLLEENGDSLVETLDTLAPTSAFAARYSPMFPCLFASANQVRKDLEPALGGYYPGLNTFTTLQLGSKGYRYPDDLPRIDDSVGPTCFGGPLHQKPGDTPFPHVNFDDGISAYDRNPRNTTEVQNDPLPILLFGDAGRELGR
jgi:phospholipid/cholesterol/gamma-HCH transport system substrate-binding protein